MKAVPSIVAFGAILVSHVAGMTPASALVLQKTIVLQRTGERAVTTDTAVTTPVTLACTGGAGQCVYETITTIQMGGNFTSGNSVGAYLSIDGNAPPCRLSDNMPADGSFFERTTLLANEAVTRGAHTMQLRLCSSSGGFHIQSYTATIRVYTAQ